jgi:hypothetical protein
MAEFDPTIDFKASDEWLQGYKTRFDITLRRTTTSHGKIVDPDDLEVMRAYYLMRIALVADERLIPLHLIVAADETAQFLLPSAHTTLAKKGEKTIPIIGADDKRQITVLFGLSLDSTVQTQPRAQCIFQGKTDRVEPEVSAELKPFIFTAHSESHWATPKTCIQYLDELARWRRSLLANSPNVDDPDTHWMMLIWDVYHAHIDSEVTAHARSRRIALVYVIPNCTDKLQLCDVALNAPFKKHIAQDFESFIADAYTDKDDDFVFKPSMEELRSHTLSWVARAFEHISKHKTAIAKGAKRIGLSSVHSKELVDRAKATADLWTKKFFKKDVLFNGGISTTATQPPPPTADEIEDDHATATQEMTMIDEDLLIELQVSNEASDGPLPVARPPAAMAAAAAPPAAAPPALAAPAPPAGDDAMEVDESDDDGPNDVGTIKIKKRTRHCSRCGAVGHRALSNKCPRTTSEDHTNKKKKKSQKKNMANMHEEDELVIS